MTDTPPNPIPKPPRPPNYHPLVVVLIAVCFGITADRVWPWPVTLWWLIALASMFAWWGLWWFGRIRIAAVAILFAVAAVGGAWHHWQWYLFAAQDLADFATPEARPVAVRAVALNEPSRLPAPPDDPLRAIPADEHSRLDIRVTAVRHKSQWRPAAGQTVLTVGGHVQGVQAGDRLQVFGHLSQLHAPYNPGEIDFAAHQRADRRRCQLRANYPECVTVVQRGSRWSPAYGLDWLRRHGGRLLWKHLDHDRSGFAAALLLGAREQLDFERTEAFLHTNTIHFLAISGLHVGILAGSLFLALRWGLLPRRLALLAVALASTLYVLLTGAPPSAVRSLVLVLLFCLSNWVWRPTLAFNCLAAAGLFILLLNPADLFRTGPQLSFLAVGTLVWFGPKWMQWQRQDALQRLVSQTRPWPLRAVQWLGRWWWRGTAVTAGVWLVTLALIMAQFHLISPVAVLLSPLLWAPIAAALMSGFGVLLFGGLVPPLGTAFGWICDRSLGLIDFLVTQASHVPGSHHWVSGPETWWLAVFYAGLALWAAMPQWRPRRLGSIALLATWIAVGLTASWADSHHEKRLDCTFLSLGHGACVILELPDGQTILYDAGRLGSPAGGARSISSFLWWRGIRRLDAIILSHADVDHYNALPGLLRRFSVDKVYVSSVMFEEGRGKDDSAALNSLRQTLDRSGVAVHRINRGESLPAGAGCALRVLHPSREGVTTRRKNRDTDNANSIVLAVEYAGRRILLPGDLEEEGIDELRTEASGDCDVLLAPHHGSRRSSPPKFVEWSKPEWVVISGNFGAGEEIVDLYRGRGAGVLHTARDGAVRVRIEDNQLSVSHWTDDRFVTTDRVSVKKQND